MCISAWHDRTVTEGSYIKTLMLLKDLEYYTSGIQDHETFYRMVKSCFTLRNEASFAEILPINEWKWNTDNIW